MAEPRGRRARWSTALAAAPGAAALFGACVAWSAQSSPQAGAVSQSSQVSAVSHAAQSRPDPQLARLRAHLDAQASRYAKAQHRLVRLHSETLHLHRTISHLSAAARALAAQQQANAAGGGYVAPAPAGGGPVVAAPPPVGGAPAPAPAPVVVAPPPPPPAPPVHAVTGASAPPP